MTTVKVYTNCDTVTLFADGKPLETKGGQKVLTFRVPLSGKVTLEAVSGEVRDQAELCYVNQPDPAYKLNKKTAGGGNWT